MDGDARLTDLEIAMTHAQAAIDDMSDVIRAQGQRIDRLEAQTARLTDRLAAAESALPDTAPEADTRPPHW